MQYTRVYVGAGDTILHVHTQDTPITTAGVEDPNVIEEWDLVLDNDPSGFVRARELLTNLEKPAGVVPPRFRAGAPRTLNIRSSGRRS